MIDVRIKVCGLKDVPSALSCAEAGVDWIGLNFHPPSPRSISLERAAEITSALPEHVEAVGLFVDRDPAAIAAVADGAGLDLIQLHGQEPPEDLLALAPRRIVRAFRLGDLASIDRMVAYLRRAEELGHPPEAILVDAYVPGHPGGTGHSIAASLLADLPSHPRLILAGGLSPGNVAERVALVRPWMVDVASGVESAPGLKDSRLVSSFVAAARHGIAAGADRQTTP
ncbi:phosphoribosylanthranilate isomerase [Tundrisphaera sp. TA3]|uniref:phosphoribosylanthranilate isomerase n=1 Tax=Tundrisphaera sp. TA3 TaxID=3435775 RepID=UPI003EBD1C23